MTRHYYDIAEAICCVCQRENQNAVLPYFWSTYPDIRGTPRYQWPDPRKEEWNIKWRKASDMSKSICCLFSIDYEEVPFCEKHLAETLKALRKEMN